MAKHKKTKEQKKLADMRRRSIPLQVENLAVLPSSQKTEQPASQARITYSVTPTVHAKQPTNSLLNPTYVTQDLKRTAFITTGIFAAQILLFILMHNHILATPGNG